MVDVQVQHKRELDPQLAAGGNDGAEVLQVVTAEDILTSMPPGSTIPMAAAPGTALRGALLQKMSSRIV